MIQNSPKEFGLAFRSNLNSRWATTTFPDNLRETIINLRKVTMITIESVTRRYPSRTKFPSSMAEVEAIFLDALPNAHAKILRSVTRQQEDRVCTRAHGKAKRKNQPISVLAFL